MGRHNGQVQPRRQAPFGTAGAQPGADALLMALPGSNMTQTRCSRATGGRQIDSWERKRIASAEQLWDLNQDNESCGGSLIGTATILLRAVIATNRPRDAATLTIQNLA